MPNAEPPALPPVPREFSPLAGLLSYLVPGLGQISQGRTGKGLLFLVSIYSLFFYGMYLGTGTVKAAGAEYRVPGNVYLPDTVRDNVNDRFVNPYNLPAFAVNLYNRPQFAGQFWVGIAAWPALFQYASDDDQRVREEADRRRAEADRLAETQPEAAARLRKEADELREGLRTGTGQGNWLLGQFERAPTEEALNALNTSRGKELELAWVYTVIAGVLNIMVIYDAIAGPAFLPAAQPPGPGKGV
jgi:hypothetical protein